MLLGLRDVTVTYGDRVALDSATLNVAGGEIVGLLGPNGAGKSTLLKAICGLVPTARGAISLDGEYIDRAARRRIAYTPQRSEVDWSFPITVEEVVLLGRQAHLGLFGRPGKRDRTIALDALERLRIDDRRRDQVGELSGGQQQRVFLARALAQGGDVLLLDEPLTGVDAPTHALLLDLLDELRREGRVVIVATHDLAQAASMCDRLCLLSGRIVAAGSPPEVLTRETLAETYGAAGVLDLPQVNGASPDLAWLPVALPHGAGAVCHDH